MTHSNFTGNFTKMSAAAAVMAVGLAAALPAMAAVGSDAGVGVKTGIQKDSSAGRLAAGGSVGTGVNGNLSINRGTNKGSASTNTEINSEGSVSSGSNTRSDVNYQGRRPTIPLDDKTIGYGGNARGTVEGSGRVSPQVGGSDPNANSPVDYNNMNRSETGDTTIRR